MCIVPLYFVKPASVFGPSPHANLQNENTLQTRTNCDQKSSSEQAKNGMSIYVQTCTFTLC